MQQVIRAKSSRFALALVVATAVALCATLLMGAGTAQAASINKKSLSMTAKQTYSLAVKGTKKAVKWTSSKKSVAKVTKKGVVTAKKAGTATIKAKVGKKTYQCTVTVLSKKAAQKKANALYKKQLAKKSVTLNGTKYTTSELYFALVDWNKDGVKDLLLTKKGAYSIGTSDYDCCVYIYSFGKIKGYVTTMNNLGKNVYRISKTTELANTSTEATYRMAETYYKWDLNGVRYKYATVSLVMSNVYPEGYDSADVYVDNSYSNPIYIYDANINGGASTYEGVTEYYATFKSFTYTPYPNTSSYRTSILK